jgi:adenosylcobinamide-phosphate synthase
MSAALRTAVRDGRKHPSPNSGWSEAAYAGAVGRRLGGRNEYGGRIEDRPELGAGEPPTTADIGRAARLCAVVTGLAALLAVGVARRPLLRFGRPGRHPGRRSRCDDR